MFGYPLPHLDASSSGSIDSYPGAMYAMFYFGLATHGVGTIHLMFLAQDIRGWWDWMQGRSWEFWYAYSNLHPSNVLSTNPLNNHPGNFYVGSIASPWVIRKHLETYILQSLYLSLGLCLCSYVSIRYWWNIFFAVSHVGAYLHVLNIIYSSREVISPPYTIQILVFCKKDMALYKHLLLLLSSPRAQKFKVIVFCFVPQYIF